MSECPTCKGTGWIWSIEIPGLRKRCECCGGTGQKRSCEKLKVEMSDEPKDL